MTEQTFTSAEIVRLAKVTARQLQWWDERHVVEPERAYGRRRFYSGDQALEVLVVAELRRKGMSLQKVRRVHRHLRRELARSRGLDQVAYLAQRNICLLTDGRAVAYASESDMLPILTRATRPMFVVSISDQARRVRPFYEVSKKAS